MSDATEPSTTLLVGTDDANAAVTSTSAAETAAEVDVTEGCLQLYIGNFGIPDLQADVLQAHLEAKGLVVKKIDMKQRFAFCYVTHGSEVMKSDEDIKTFVDSMEGSAESLPGADTSLKIQFAKKKTKKEGEDPKSSGAANRDKPSDTLFVVNFDVQTTTEDELRDLFANFGPVVRVEKKSTFAFVQFESIEVATKAKEGTHGGHLAENKLTVEFTQNGNSKPRNRNRRGDDGRGGGGGGRGMDYNRGGGGGGGYRGDPPMQPFPPQRGGPSGSDGYGRGPPPGGG